MERDITIPATELPQFFRLVLTAAYELFPSEAPSIFALSQEDVLKRGCQTMRDRLCEYISVRLPDEVLSKIVLEADQLENLFEHLYEKYTETISSAAPSSAADIKKISDGYFCLGAIFDATTGDCVAVGSVGASC